MPDNQRIWTWYLTQHFFSKDRQTLSARVKHSEFSRAQRVNIINWTILIFREYSFHVAHKHFNKDITFHFQESTLPVFTMFSFLFLTLLFSNFCPLNVLRHCLEGHRAGLRFALADMLSLFGISITKKVWYNLVLLNKYVM